MKNTTEKQPRYYLGLCAIAKDETPYLREWVAYHHYIGFEKIYIYDNGSVVPVRETLAGLSGKDILTVYDMPGDAMQLPAYTHCLRQHGQECMWLAFFDLDEFLYLKEDADARILLRDYESFSGLALHWDMFSSSGHLSHPGGMAMEQYRQSIGASSYCKSIVQPSTVRSPISPHHFWYTSGCAVATDGSPALGPFITQCTNKAWINHYSYRSQEDYQWKMEKGSAVYVKTHHSYEKFYRQAAAPFTEKTGILPLAREVADLLEKNVFRMRLDITLDQTYAMNFGKAAALVGKFLQLGEYAMAETIFSLCYKRFADNILFLQLGVLLFRETGKHRRALALMREKMLFYPPDVPDYRLYLDCLTDNALVEDMQRMATLLLHNAFHTHDKKLQSDMERYAERHNLTLPPPLGN